jgi:hypothetical protein
MTSRLDLTNELLRHEDIEGLLSMGAPDDEYESEAEMIGFTPLSQLIFRKTETFQSIAARLAP